MRLLKCKLIMIITLSTLLTSLNITNTHAYTGLNINDSLLGNAEVATIFERPLKDGNSFFISVDTSIEREIDKRVVANVGNNAIKFIENSVILKDLAKPKTPGIVYVILRDLEEDVLGLTAPNVIEENQKNIIYVDYELFKKNSDVDRAAGIIVHEFQHLINYSYDNIEHQTMLNEGISSYIEGEFYKIKERDDLLKGITSQYIGLGDKQWDKSLYEIEPYGKGYMYVDNLVEMYGEQRIKDLITSKNRKDLNYLEEVEAFNGVEKETTLSFFIEHTLNNTAEARDDLILEDCTKLSADEIVTSIKLEPLTVYTKYFYTDVDGGVIVKIKNKDINALISKFSKNNSSIQIMSSDEREETFLYVEKGDIVSVTPVPKKQIEEELFEYSIVVDESQKYVSNIDDYKPSLPEIIASYLSYFIFRIFSFIWY